MNREWRMKRRAPCFFLTKKPFYCIIISVVCRCGEIGRHEGLKIPFWRQSTGSTPVGGIKRPPKLTLEGLFILLILHLAAVQLCPHKHYVNMTPAVAECRSKMYAELHGGKV